MFAITKKEDYVMKVHRYMCHVEGTLVLEPLIPPEVCAHNSAKRVSQKQTFVVHFLHKCECDCWVEATRGDADVATVFDVLLNTSRYESLPRLLLLIGPFKPSSKRHPQGWWEGPQWWMEARSQMRLSDLGLMMIPIGAANTKILKWVIVKWGRKKREGAHYKGKGNP